VTAADAEWLAPARWSRFVTRRIKCPDVSTPERFIEWLLRFGEREPGHVLCPTSDDVAWLYSEYRDALSSSFRLYQPSAETLRLLLDKKELYAACEAVGLGVPLTYFPESEGDAAAIAREASFPILIKPATQVLRRGHVKGVGVHRREELLPAYRSYTAANTYHPWLANRMPTADRPMLQAFHPEAAQSIHSVAGFVDASGEALVALAAKKVLQRPRTLGIGLCFEEAPLRSDLTAALGALCRRVGYFGVFEAEFIDTAEGCLLIDFNPRFYSQMSFEIDRGLPLPLLAYEAALGRDTALEAALACDPAPQGRAYTHRFILALMTRVQRLAGRMTREESEVWHRWLEAHRGRITDAIADPDDRLPAVMSIARSLYGYASHPRVTVRSMVLNR
jgi:predicted ATP-grasp superfamily ATP-dependent carboligase